MDSESPSAYPTKDDLTARSASGDPVARLTRSGQARQIETGPMAVTPDASRTVRRGTRKMSAYVLRLAKRLGADPDELAKSYPEDTLRRTKYPMVEDPQPDGSILFKDIRVE